MIYRMNLQMNLRILFEVYIHETSEKTSKLLKTYNNKLEALGYIEELVEDFITQKNGEDRGKEDIIVEPSSYKSMRWRKLPYGFFKTRNTKESLYKITVWCKKLNEGYLYNSYEVFKVFSVDIISLPTGNQDLDEETDLAYEDFIYKKQHEESMIQLRKELQELIDEHVECNIELNNLN